MSFSGRRSSAMSFPGRLSWVVLRKQVPIFYAEEKDQEDEIMAKATKDWGDIEDGSWMLDQFSLDLHLVQPPELSTLSLRVNTESRDYGIMCLLESVVENFLVMTLLFDNSSYWLVYDAAKNSLSLLPATMDSFAAADDEPFIYLRQPAVLPHDDGYCDLLDLGLWFDGSHEWLPRSGVLSRWSNRGPGNMWTKQEARFLPPTLLPPQCPYPPIYEADVVFAFKGKVFWVDLRLGAIVCDVLSTGTSQDVDLDFIQLPHECQGRDFSHCYPKERRTMGPVGDSIRLISIVTTNGDTPREYTTPADVVLRSWTFSADLCSWTRDDDMELPLPLLWESELYKSKRLPRAVPQNPVMKADEDGVLYLLLGDYYRDWETRARLCREIECVISIDMRIKSLLSCSHRTITDGLPAPMPWAEVQPSKDFSPDMPSLFAAKFCASHTGWSDAVLPKKETNRLTDGKTRKAAQFVALEAV